MLSVNLLTVTENGYGKRIGDKVLPIQACVGKGTITDKVDDNRGKVMAAVLVPPSGSTW